MEVLRPVHHEDHLGTRKLHHAAPALPPAGDGPAAAEQAPVIPPEEDVEAPLVDEDTDEDTTSIMCVIPEDHDRIKGLYRRYKDPTDSPHQRQLLAYQLLRELNVHMLAEESVVYPVVAEQVEEHMRDHAIDEHDSLKLFASDLEGMKLGDEGWEDKLHQLMETFLEHIQDEEHRMLPALRATMAESELREMGKRFEEAKRHMPTRPHHTDAKHPAPFDDATLLLDAARDAAAFEGQPPAIGSDSTEVLRETKPAAA